MRVSGSRHALTHNQRNCHWPKIPGSAQQLPKETNTQVVVGTFPRIATTKSYFLQFLCSLLADINSICQKQL
jgi:hypothetical protein